MKEPVLKQKEQFSILGISARTTNEKEMTSEGQIPQLWNQFYTEPVFEKVQGIVDHQTVYGVYSDYTDGVQGVYQITLGKEIHADRVTQSGLVEKTIPAATYLVFTSEKGPVTQIVGKLWHEIWQWFEHAKVQRTFTGDFEVYDERCTNPEEAQIDVYIAIKV